jgi:hypothetical protein
MTGKTVLVLGAGASCEVNLPSGDKLKNDIASLLRYEIDDLGRTAKMDSHIREGYTKLAGKAGSRDINPYLRASRKIVDGLPLVLSIDNFLDLRRGEKDVEVCGKLAIARAILKAEAGSKLTSARNQEGISMPSIQQTWFAKFFQLLCEGCPLENLRARLGSIALVVFNYDRCFEHFLYHALQQAYGVSPSEAAGFVSSVEIYHAYGTVGALPWQLGGTLPWTAKGPKIPFGGLEHGSGTELVEISENLKTFTESTDEAIAGSVRNLVATADRVIFLGFAFHGLNLEFLFGGKTRRKPGTGRCFGSAYGMSTSNVESIQSDLVDKGGFLKDRIVLSNSVCADLVSDNSRLFSFR